MFDWLKRLLGKKPAPVEEEQKTETPKMLEKPCRSCGKPILYDPNWAHAPNYCKECKRKFQEEKGLVSRKCRSCGKTFTVPATVKHMPNYCKACRAKFREKKE